MSPCGPISNKERQPHLVEKAPITYLLPPPVLITEPEGMWVFLPLSLSVSRSLSCLLLTLMDEVLSLLFSLLLSVLHPAELHRFVAEQ